MFVTKLRLNSSSDRGSKICSSWWWALRSGEIFRLLFAPSIPWKQQTHQDVGCVRQRGRGRVTHWSFLHSEVFCAYRLCISRHASASGLTHSMFSSTSQPTMANTVEAVSEGWFVSTTSTCLPFPLLVSLLLPLPVFLWSTCPPWSMAEITHRGVSVTFSCSISNLLCFSLNPLIDSWTLHQGWLGKCVKLCWSITILSGRNNVPVSARRSLQYSF